MRKKFKAFRFEARLPNFRNESLCHIRQSDSFVLQRHSSKKDADWVTKNTCSSVLNFVRERQHLSYHVSCFGWRSFLNNRIGLVMGVRTNSTDLVDKTIVIIIKAAKNRSFKIYVLIKAPTPKKPKYFIINPCNKYT